MIRKKVTCLTSGHSLGRVKQTPSKNMRTFIGTSLPELYTFEQKVRNIKRSFGSIVPYGE
jgi:hypothetical protein